MGNTQAIPFKYLITQLHGVFQTNDTTVLPCKNRKIQTALCQAFLPNNLQRHAMIMLWNYVSLRYSTNEDKQGKSEGFETCDRPIVRKRPIWVKIGDVLSRVTLKFDGWPWKTIGHPSFAVSSFVQHFIAIGALKLELLSGDAQFGSNSTIFRAVWPWNLTYDLEKE